MAGGEAVTTLSTALLASSPKVTLCAIWKPNIDRKWHTMSVGVAVVDAWALLAFLRGEGQAGRSMRRYLKRARAGNLRLVLNLINLGEAYYRIAQLRGLDEAAEALELIRELPLELYPVRERLVLEAARLKAAHPLSYADAFAVATARHELGPVITGDPKILDLPKGIVAVRRLGERNR